MKKNRFTMIELLVVIGIIGILATLILGSMGGGVLATQKTRAKGDMAAMVAGAISKTAINGKSYGETGFVSTYTVSTLDLTDLIGENKDGKDPWGISYDSITFDSDFERWEVEVNLGDEAHQGIDDNLPNITIYSWKETSKN